MKMFLALFVSVLSVPVFADEPSAVFDATSVFDSASGLIANIVLALGAVLVSAAAFYLALLAWNKYKEVCYHVAVENHDVEWLGENNDWVANHGFIPLDDLVDEEGNFIDSPAPDCLCETGVPCPHTDECYYWTGNCCGLGME